MKTKIIIVILAVACIGLVIALVVTKNSSDEQHAKDTSSIVDFSNQVVGANLHIDQLDQVNLSLTNDLAVSHQEATDLSNSLITANATLASTKASLASAQDQVVTLTNQISGLNGQISDLQAQNRVLDQRATDLTNTIAQLNVQIEDTENKLAIAQTNNAYIAAELQKQLAEKADLERQFNDLDIVRAQVKKLKDELFVARRMDLEQYQNGNKKGGALLIQRTPLSTPPKQPQSYDLNVEVGSDGSVKVIPPLGSTNSAAH
jgi:DNA repair exonuclease SbcCD ATPase subunit